MADAEPDENRRFEGGDSENDPFKFSVSIELDGSLPRRRKNKRKLTKNCRTADTGRSGMEGPNTVMSRGRGSSSGSRKVDSGMDVDEVAVDCSVVVEDMVVNDGEDVCKRRFGGVSNGRTKRCAGEVLVIDVDKNAHERSDDDARSGACAENATDERSVMTISKVLNSLLCLNSN